MGGYTFTACGCQNSFDMSIKELGYKMCVGDVSLSSKQESRQLSYFFSNSFFVANIRTYLFEQWCNII